METRAASQSSSPNTAILNVLVEKHAIQYQSWPAYEIVDGERVHVGYDLELCGVHASDHDGTSTELRPGCGRCLAVWRDLRAVADAVIPPETTGSDYRIRRFDSSWHFDGRMLSGGPIRVQLIVEIRNRAGGLAPEIDCERRCLERMTEDLRRLAVKPRG